MLAHCGFMGKNVERHIKNFISELCSMCLCHLRIHPFSRLDDPASEEIKFEQALTIQVLHRVSKFTPQGD